MILHDHDFRKRPQWFPTCHAFLTSATCSAMFQDGPRMAQVFFFSPKLPWGPPTMAQVQSYESLLARLPETRLQQNSCKSHSTMHGIDWNESGETITQQNDAKWTSHQGQGEGIFDGFKTATLGFSPHDPAAKDHRIPNWRNDKEPKHKAFEEESGRRMIRNWPCTTKTRHMLNLSEGHRVETWRLESRRTSLSLKIKMTFQSAERLSESNSMHCSWTSSLTAGRAI